MTKEELHELLQSRPFKVNNPDNPEFDVTYTFTEDEIKSGKTVVGGYELEEENDKLKIVFKNPILSTSEFKNILLVSDNVIVTLNYDYLKAQEKPAYRISLEGQ